MIKKTMLTMMILGCANNVISMQSSSPTDGRTTPQAQVVSSGSFVANKFDPEKLAAYEREQASLEDYYGMREECYQRDQQRGKAAAAAAPPQVVTLQDVIHGTNWAQPPRRR